MKRLFDIVASGFGLILLSPVFLILSIMIVADSPGGVFSEAPESAKTEKLSEYLNFALWSRTARERESGMSVTMTTESHAQVIF